MNNDTPRTNAEAVWPASNDDSDKQSPDGSHVPVEFAHELERENTRLRAALTKALRYVEAYEPRTRNGEVDQLDTIRTAKILLSA